MIRFNCDYQEGAHPRILSALVDSNMVQTCGYGEDEICEEARNQHSPPLRRAAGRTYSFWWAARRRTLRCSRRR